jgi:hypothetical protein
MINLVELKQYLNITDDSKNTFLQECIDRAISELESDCNRKFTSGSCTEYYANEKETYDLYLRHYPVRLISSCTYETSDGTFEDVTEDSDNLLLLDGTYIHIVGGDYFPKAMIKTVYNYGYQISGSYGTPDDFKQVLLEKAALHWYNSPVSTQARLGVTSKNVGSQNTTSATYEKPDHSGFINKYRIRNI